MNHARKRARRGAAIAGAPARCFSFNSFADPGCPCDYRGAFRDNVRAFLQTVAEEEGSSSSSSSSSEEELHHHHLCGADPDHDHHHDHHHHQRPVAVWSVSLQEETRGAILPLLVLEEDMQIRSVAPPLHCDHCRSAGARIGGE
jgi:hypothetical protein